MYNVLAVIYVNKDILVAFGAPRQLQTQHSLITFSAHLVAGFSTANQNKGKTQIQNPSQF